MLSMILGVTICVLTLIQLYAVKNDDSVLAVSSGAGVILLSAIRFAAEPTGLNGCLLVLFLILQGSIITKEMKRVIEKRKVRQHLEIALELLDIDNLGDVLQWGKMKSIGDSLSCYKYLTEKCGLRGKCGLREECAECTLSAALRHVGDSQYIQCFIKDLGTSERIGILEYKQSTLVMAQSLIPYLHLIYLIPQYRGKGIEKKVVYALQQMGSHLWG